MNFPITYVVEGSRAATSGSARDLGGGGMCFESAAPLAEDTLVHLTFELQPSQPMSVRGRVIDTGADPQQTAFQHHVEFCDIDESVRDSILAYIIEARRNALTSHSESTFANA